MTPRPWTAVNGCPRNVALEISAVDLMAAQRGPRGWYVRMPVRLAAVVMADARYGGSVRREEEDIPMVYGTFDE
jgi:hypothetical protein